MMGMLLRRHRDTEEQKPELPKAQTDKKEEQEVKTDDTGRGKRSRKA